MLPTARQRAAWEEHGWCVIEGVLSPDELAGARRALGHLFPAAAEMDAAGDDERTARWRDWDATWPELPFRSRTLNGIALHPSLLDLAEALVGPDVRLYMALASAKYAGQPSGFNQLLHVDYPNQSLVVPRDDDGYRLLELFVYLCDVTPTNGATRFVSRTLTAGIPAGRHTLDVAGHAHLYDAPGDASAPAGSVVAYRPDVYHRSVDWTEPGNARYMLHLGYRPAANEWAGFQAWPFKGLTAEWHRLVTEQATPRQLTALGFPAPGHPYWTEETLAGVADRYPGLDLTPWHSLGR
ncbi:MAG: phytanoyl-CoA dioxygenase family protein [Acidimicrobiales bacterium]